jgi:hypothetical protein
MALALIDYCDGDHHLYAAVTCNYCEREYCWGCSAGNHPDDGDWEGIICPHCGCTYFEPDWRLS